MSRFSWHNVYYATVGYVTNCTEQKNGGGAPLPGRNRHFCVVLWDVLYFAQEYRVYLCFYVLCAAKNRSGVSCRGATPSSRSARRERVCYCPLGIDYAACFFLAYPLSDFEPRGVLRARALIDARARTR